MQQASTFEVIPVMDLKEGLVVRGERGERDCYQPIESQLTTANDLMSIADVLHQRFGFEKFYLADLDSIQKSTPIRHQNHALYSQLAEKGYRLMVDNGIRFLRDVSMLFCQGASQAIIGLEMNPSEELLKDVITTFAADQLIFSLDLYQHVPLGLILQSPDEAELAETEKQQTYLEVVETVYSLGYRNLIVLDLASVGTDAGLSTVSICKDLLHHFPDLNLVSGGGVRSVLDLNEMKELGLSGALVASAIHNGSLTCKDINGFRL